MAYQTDPQTGRRIERRVPTAPESRAGTWFGLSFDRDVEGHLDVVFGVAQKHGVDVDIHLHDGGVLGAFEVEQIAARTRAFGMEGRVAVVRSEGAISRQRVRPRLLAISVDIASERRQSSAHSRPIFACIHRRSAQSGSWPGAPTFWPVLLPTSRATGDASTGHTADGGRAAGLLRW